MTYARFAIDAQGFESLELNHDPSYSAFKHFLCFWREYGIYVELKKDIASLRDSLPDDLRTEWDHTRKQILNLSKRWVRSAAEIADVMRGIHNGGSDVLNALALDVVGVQDGDWSALLEKFRGNVASTSIILRDREEICRIYNLLISETVAELRRVREGDIGREERPEKIWSAKILPLFRAHDLVAAVDQYALQNFVRHKNDLLQSGLGRLLERISVDGNKIGEVEVITSSRADARDMTDDELRSGVTLLEEFGRAHGVKRTTVMIAPPHVARALMHSRYFYGALHTIDVDNGLDVLSASRQRIEHYNFKPTPSERARAYSELHMVGPRMKKVRFA